ncbi:MAG: hypothetical protein ABFD92_04390 [Planctomycetaceae bacterium]
MFLLTDAFLGSFPGSELVKTLPDIFWVVGGFLLTLPLPKISGHRLLRHTIRWLLVVAFLNSVLELIFEYIYPNTHRSPLMLGWMAIADGIAACCVAAECWYLSHVSRYLGDNTLRQRFLKWTWFTLLTLVAAVLITPVNDQPRLDVPLSPHVYLAVVATMTVYALGLAGFIWRLRRRLSELKVRASTLL